MKSFLKSKYPAIVCLYLLFYNIQPSKSQVLSKEDWIWTTNIIDVCWINPSVLDLKEREWVQRAIKKTWEAESKLSFKGWCKCDDFVKDANNGIRIKISDEPARTSNIGRLISKDSIGMFLDFKFSKGVFLPIEKELKKKDNTSQESRVSRVYPINEEDRKLFIEAQAVHEFGHSLGFTHEQIRPNCTYGSDCNFPEKILSTITDLTIPCNERSVMNYCNDIYLNEGFLSHIDKKMLDLIYKKENKKAEDTIKIVFKRNELKKNENENIQRQEVAKSTKILARKIKIKLDGKPELLKDITRVEYFFHRNTFKPMVISGYYQA